MVEHLETHLVGFQLQQLVQRQYHHQSGSSHNRHVCTFNCFHQLHPISIVAGASLVHEPPSNVSLLNCKLMKCAHDRIVIPGLMK
jgi:hypothetical protein